MDKFDVKEIVSQDTIKLSFSGHLNENAVLPEFKRFSNVIINLRDVKYINSAGTRTWCTWIKTIPIGTKISFEECPMLFVRAFNYIIGFLPQNSIVDSFSVPFVSDDEEEFTVLLFRRGEHFNEHGIKQVKVLDSKGKPMEIDVANSYFSFLKK